MSWDQVLGDAAEHTAREEHRKGLLERQWAEQRREAHEQEDREQESRYRSGAEARTRANLRRDEVRRQARGAER